MHTSRAMDNEVALARSELGMSRPQFADVIGVARTTVMRWEKGERRVPLATLRLIRSMVEEHRRGSQSNDEPAGAAA